MAKIAPRPRFRKTPPAGGGLGSLLPGLLAATLTVGAAPPATAQAPEPTAEVDSALALADGMLALGDTVEALRILRAASDRYPRSAEAHFRRAYLLYRFGGLQTANVGRRADAGDALRAALEIDPTNPRYLVELGYHRAQSTFLRFDAERIFRRALRVASERSDPQAVADVAAAMGDMARRRSEIISERRLATGSGPQFDPDRAIADWRYTEEFLANHSMVVRGSGEMDRRVAEDHYRLGFAARPAHQGAALGLLTLLADDQRLEEYLTVARAFVAAAPRNPRAHMALGMGFARLGRISEASALFDTALAIMSPAERAPIFDLAPILRRQEAGAYRQLPDSSRLVFDRLYWDARDPLRLTPANEFRIEYLSRVTYADMRFGDRERAIRGLETAPGVIYVRYGPPDVAASFPPTSPSVANDPLVANRIITVWWYPTRKLRFAFRGSPGVGPMRFAGDFETYADEARFIAPARYDNIPLVAALDSVPLQVVRLRGATGGTVVHVFAGVPLGRMLDSVALARANLEVGLFVTDAASRTLLARRGEEVVDVRAERQFENRSYEFGLPNGLYHLRVEAREASSHRAARGEQPLVVPKDGATGFALSDVIIASRIAPRVETRRGLRDFSLQPNPAMSFEPGQPVHLYWEMYEPSSDSADVARYQVTVLVRNTAIERRDLAARIIGGVGDAIGLTAEGDHWVSLSYQNQTPLAGRDRIPEYLSVDLGTAPEGAYELVLRVRDLVAAEERSETLSFRVQRGRAARAP